MFIYFLCRRTLKEVTNGHGGSCGSAFLDVNMREYIKRKFSHLGSINDTAMEHIMDTFVNIIKVKNKTKGKRKRRYTAWVKIIHSIHYLLFFLA